MKEFPRTYFKKKKAANNKLGVGPQSLEEFREIKAGEQRSNIIAANHRDVLRKQGKSTLNSTLETIRRVGSTTSLVSECICCLFSGKSVLMMTFQHI